MAARRNIAAQPDDLLGGGVVDSSAGALETRHCLLLGARGFLGRRLEKRLRVCGVAVTGTTRALHPDDPPHWIEVRLDAEGAAPVAAVPGFDLIIVAARLFEATCAPSAELGERLRRFFAALQRPAIGAERAPLVVYVSSDAVFSGDRGGYVETDVADASSEYGACHRIAESALQAVAPRHLIFRPSFLFDPDDVEGDRRIAGLVAAIAEGRTIEADVNVYKSPARVEAVARRIVEAAMHGEVGIRHVDAPRKSVHDFLLECIDAARLPVRPGVLARRVAARSTDTSLLSNYPMSMT